MHPRALSFIALIAAPAAQQHGGDPRADKVLSRLLALSEYDHFCDMMRRAHGEMVDVDDPDAGYYT